MQIFGMFWRWFFAGAGEAKGGTLMHLPLTKKKVVDGKADRNFAIPAILQNLVRKMRKTNRSIKKCF